MFNQNTLSCQLCNRPIYGRYLQYSNGLLVCEQCEQTTPHCERCKLPSHQLIATRNGKLCPTCLQTSPVCDLCHEPILSNYKVYNGNLKVCAKCERTATRCARCGIPSRQLIPVRGVAVCPACLKASPVCDCCHIPILDNYGVFEGSANCYCATCMTTRPRCGVCNAPINEQGRVFRGSEGETRRCGNCLRTAITTNQQAEPLYRQVRELLRQELSLNIDVLPPLTLVGRERLEALHGQTGVGASSNLPPGVEPAHLQGFFHRVNDRQNIYIEHYLPQAQFQSVAAHELAHAWQAAHSPHNQPERIVEGFAEWAAYSALQALGERAEAERLTKRNDIYGEGLRYFLDLERKRGRQAVLQRAQR